MRVLFVCLALVVVAAAHEFSNDQLLLEVTTSVDKLKKKGATLADCKDLAKTECKEVLSERKNQQVRINTLKSGKHCLTLGQAGVKRALAHYTRIVRTWKQMKIKVTTASNASVSISAQRYSSLKQGRCGFIFSSRSYLKAKATYKRAVRTEVSWKGRVSESHKMYLKFVKLAARQVKSCHCRTKAAATKTWSVETKSATLNKQTKAYAKCKMMQCVLAGTALTSKKCKGTLATLVKKVLYKDTQATVCTKKAATKKATGNKKKEKKTKAAKKEKKTKAARKEKKTKAVRKEKKTKAVKKEKKTKAARKEKKTKAVKKEKKTKAARKEKKTKAVKKEKKTKAAKKEKKTKAAKKEKKTKAAKKEKKTKAAKKEKKTKAAKKKKSERLSKAKKKQEKESKASIRRYKEKKTKLGKEKLKKKKAKKAKEQKKKVAKAKEVKSKRESAAKKRKEKLKKAVAKEKKAKLIATKRKERLTKKRTEERKAKERKAKQVKEKRGKALKKAKAAAEKRAKAWVKLGAARSGVMNRDLSSSKLSIMRSAKKVRFAWNRSGSPSNGGRKPTDYQYVVEFNPKGMRNQNHNMRGNRCNDGNTFKLVNVKCVKGNCNMPAQMYFGMKNGKMCYGNSYGLVQNMPQGNGQCDWGVDGQRFRSIYFNLRSRSRYGWCSKSKDRSNTIFKPTNSAMFAKR